MTTIIAIIALVISICAIYEIEKLKKNDVKNINVWIYKKKILIKTNSRSSTM